MTWSCAQLGMTPKSPAASRPSAALALARSPAPAAGGELGDGASPAAAELSGHWAGLNRLVHRSHLTLKLPTRASGSAFLSSLTDMWLPCGVSNRQHAPEDWTRLSKFVLSGVSSPLCVAGCRSGIRTSARRCAAADAAGWRACCCPPGP